MLSKHGGFNTQPPEGGCTCAGYNIFNCACFNTQPPEGGCMSFCQLNLSVHCFNTQPPEGGCLWFGVDFHPNASFNTQPPEGGCLYNYQCIHHIENVSTHSHPKVAAAGARRIKLQNMVFQHTATRRWLPMRLLVNALHRLVSTHSHPKVAASGLVIISA